MLWCWDTSQRKGRMTRGQAQPLRLGRKNKWVDHSWLNCDKRLEYQTAGISEYRSTSCLLPGRSFSSAFWYILAPPIQWGTPRRSRTRLSVAGKVPRVGPKSPFRGNPGNPHSWWIASASNLLQLRPDLVQQVDLVALLLHCDQPPQATAPSNHLPLHLPKDVADFR